MEYTKLDKKVAYEEYVRELSDVYDSLKYYSEMFGYYSKEDIAMVEAALKEFGDIINRLKQVGDLKEAKKYVKLKKVTEYYMNK